MWRISVIGSNHLPIAVECFPWDVVISYNIPLPRMAPCSWYSRSWKRQSQQERWKWRSDLPFAWCVTIRERQVFSKSWSCPLSGALRVTVSAAISRTRRVCVPLEVRLPKPPSSLDRNFSLPPKHAFISKDTVEGMGADEFTNGVRVARLVEEDPGRLSGRGTLCSGYLRCTQ